MIVFAGFLEKFLIAKCMTNAMVKYLCDCMRWNASGELIYNFLKMQLDARLSVKLRVSIE